MVNCPARTSRSTWRVTAVDIGRQLRWYLSAPSPEKRLLPFHRAALWFAQVPSPGGDGCGRPRYGHYVHSGTEISIPAFSSGESVSPVHSEAAREKSRAFAGLCT